jgi:GxxExxY protein
MSEFKLVLPELSYRVMGCVFAVYNELGPGHLERNYQKALMVELQSQGLKCNMESAAPVFYKGEKIGNGRIDILIEDKIVLELKRGSFFSPNDFKQLGDYLSAINAPLGILIRFAPDKVVYKRVINHSLAA